MYRADISSYVVINTREDIMKHLTLGIFYFEPNSEEKKKRLIYFYR
jgi:hypothetical protein